MGVQRSLWLLVLSLANSIGQSAYLMSRKYQVRNLGERPSISSRVEQGPLKL